MTAEELRQRKEEVTRLHGEWTGHNFHIAEGVFTVEKHLGDPKLRRVVQVVSDLAGRPLDQLRVPALGCLEGQYAIEFARHGARVVAVDGREVNLAKARFVKDALSLTNLDLVKDDVRNLSKARYGEFDVVLCLGLLYHLAAADMFPFVEKMYEACARMVVLDTHVNMKDRESYEYKNHRYWGASYREHEEGASNEERLDQLWSSLDNTFSIWPTRPSLLNLLNHVGFSSVFECFNPAEVGKPTDRLTLVAFAGKKVPLYGAPQLEGQPFADWPEHAPVVVNPLQSPLEHVKKRVSALVPRPIVRGVKSLLLRLGLIRRGSVPWEWPVPWKSRTRATAETKDAKPS